MGECLRSLRAVAPRLAAPLPRLAPLLPRLTFDDTRPRRAACYHRSAAAERSH